MKVDRWIGFGFVALALMESPCLLAALPFWTLVVYIRRNLRDLPTFTRCIKAPDQVRKEAMVKKTGVESS